MEQETASEDRGNKGEKVTYTELIINIASTVFKFLAGIIDQSTAMIADAVHSVSDTASDLIVLLGFRYAKKSIVILTIVDMVR